MANPDFGYCVCPLCGHDQAAVRIAVNNKAYISCDACVSNVRTLSSVGDKAIRALMTQKADLPLRDRDSDGTPAKPSDDKPAIPARKQSSLGSALALLSGDDDE